MEKCDAVAEGGHDSLSTGYNDEQSDDLAAWASGLRRRAHLCKSLWSLLDTLATRYEVEVLLISYESSPV